MKNTAWMGLAILVTSLLAGCANTNNHHTPSLQENSAPTSRLPSPGNIQRNVLMQSNTMVAPVRP